MSGDPVSDIQRMVALGYPENLCKTSLKDAKGDYSLALRMVQQKMNASATNSKVVIDSSWTKEQDDDWLRNVRTSAVSLDAKTRALGKSPIYVRIPSWERQYEDTDNNNLDTTSGGSNNSEPKYTVMYKVSVTLKDSRRWDVFKSFDDFFRLYTLFPYGACKAFQSPFPKRASVMNAIGIFTPSESQIEERRSRLESWLLEVCLTESCMSSDVILNLVYSFVQADAHGGRVTNASTPVSTGDSAKSSGSEGVSIHVSNCDSIQGQIQGQQQSSSSSLSGGGGRGGGVTAPALDMTCNSPSSVTAIRTRILQYKHIMKLPVTTLTSIPVPVHRLGGLLPFKVNFTAPMHNNNSAAASESLASMLGIKPPAAPSPVVSSVSSTTGDGDSSQQLETEEEKTVTSTSLPSSQDLSVKQLTKDFSRDRVIIQGKRMQGSVSGYAGLLRECELVVSTLVEEATSDPSSSSSSSSSSGAPGAAVAHTMSAEEISTFCVGVLTAAGRTESAYRSHASLSMLLDLNPDPTATTSAAITFEEEEGEKSMSLMPFLVVPESELAKPIEINFQLKRKPTNTSTISRAVAVAPGSPVKPLSPVTVTVASTSSSSNSSSSSGSSSSGKAVADWCLVCDLQAATVYKVCHPETMEALIQLKVTYYHQIFKFPSTVPASISAPAMKDKTSTWLLIDRDTTTTRRDWQDA